MQKKHYTLLLPLVGYGRNVEVECISLSVTIFYILEHPHCVGRDIVPTEHFAYGCIVKVKCKEHKPCYKQQNQCAGDYIISFVHKY